MNNEEQIKQVLAQLASAWTNGDAKLFASLFTTDCDYITFSGQHLKGRAENETVHRKLLNGFLKGSVLYGDIESIRFLNDKTAVVIGTGYVKLKWQKRVPENRKSINTNVFVKENDEWKITAFHNCRVTKPGIFLRLLMKISGND